MTNRYRVVKDYQGGEFGTGRDYTISQWVKQALEWCYMDDNDELAQILVFNSHNMQPKEVLDFISEFWSIEFRKVRKDKKHFREYDLTTYEDCCIDDYYKELFEC